jgi:hypothetical protein
MPPITSTPKGSKPLEDEQVVEEEQIDVGDVVGLMRSFQQMFEALISRLDRDKARAPVPPEGPLRASVGNDSIH